MGNSINTMHQRFGWGGVPDTERATYFNERLMMGWIELLACPSAMGCTVVNFQPKNPNGGEAEYKIKMRLSHSEHVPRYQLHVVVDGKTRQWIVGHMEKTETHLRAKPGEFVRVQVWKLTCNSMVMEPRRSALQRKSQPCMSAVRNRPTPSASDMQMMGMTIATQAKLDPLVSRSKKDNEPVKFDLKSERWVQTIAVDNRAYKLNVEPPRQLEKQRGGHHHPSMKSMNVLRILYRGKKVCVARKQRFAGALGKVEQPYLGVQIKPSETAENKAKAGGEDERGDRLKALLDVHGLMLLLMCLAWSEETMSPQIDMTDRFVHAMRTEAGDQGSAEDLGLSVQWDTDDVRQRLKHIPYALLHGWNDEQRPGDADEEEEEEEADEDADTGAGVGAAE